MYGNVGSTASMGLSFSYRAGASRQAVPRKCLHGWKEKFPLQTLAEFLGGDWYPRYSRTWPVRRSGGVDVGFVAKFRQVFIEPRDPRRTRSWIRRKTVRHDQ